MNASPFKEPVIIHGSDCSCYTGKIEAYLHHADPRAVQILEREPYPSTPPPAPALPLRRGSHNGPPLDSWWRRA